MQANTIEEVIVLLETIVSEALEKNDRTGIFAQLYLGFTRQVKEGIENGIFENGDRMKTLDVIFASRYLTALQNYKSGNGEVTQAWLTAFEAAKNDKLLVIQHLFMGMNAHINLDLGIAAFKTGLPSELPLLKNDFDLINTLLVQNIESMQENLNKLSPLLFLLDWVGKKSDEHLMAFSLRKARAHAWSVATRLTKISNKKEEESQVEELDNYVALLNKFITDPGIIGGILIKVIKWFEEKNTANIINGIQ
ncbi:MAG: DUF5995 family protein [Saprospiraceae bacterium]